MMVVRPFPTLVAMVLCLFSGKPETKDLRDKSIAAEVATRIYRSHRKTYRKKRVHEVEKPNPAGTNKRARRGVTAPEAGADPEAPASAPGAPAATAAA